MSACQDAEHAKALTTGGLLRPEGHVEETAVLEVIEGVRVDEKGDCVDGKCTKTDNGQSAEESANSVRSVHRSDTVEYACIARCSHVCLHNKR